MDNSIPPATAPPTLEELVRWAEEDVKIAKEHLEHVSKWIKRIQEEINGKARSGN